MSSCCAANKKDGTAAEGQNGAALTAQQIREGVRQHYSEIAVKSASVDGADGGSCCSTASTAANSCYAPSADPAYASKLGYTAEDLKLVPDGANLGLGCGNPVIFAKLHAGEVVVDLGSGAGFDAFIAGRKVGPTGRVIGVDMTPEMISKARRNAERNGSSTHVEFRLGEIEHLPVADGTVDVIISNCVINLVPEECKQLVFNDCVRVLKSGGRLCVSDVVTSVTLPPVVREELKNYAGCLNGATLLANLEGYLKNAGFKDIKITPKDESKEFIKTWAPNHNVTDLIISALIEAVKP